MRRPTPLVLVLALGLLAACGGARGGAAGPGAGPSSPAGGAPASASGAAAPCGASSTAASSTAIDALKAAAAKEGVFQFYGPSALSRADAERLLNAFKARYDLSINFQYTPSGSMTRDTARVITEISAGQPTTWDLMLLTDAHYAMLFSNGVLEKVDWPSLGVANPRLVTFEGTSLQAATTFVAPAYNPNLVRPEDAPKDWNDLLDPRWKGKIGVSTATHFWARLAQRWGDDQTTRFVEALGAQQPMLGTLPEIYTRVTVGELAIFSAASDSYWIMAREAGAPLTVVESVKPIIAQQYNVGILQGVRNPNQAKLMALYLLSPEGQALWQEMQHQDSMYLDGTVANRYTQGKDIMTLDPKFGAEQLDDLTAEYGRLVGYR